MNRTLLGLALGLGCSRLIAASELCPIVEVETGYFFGATRAGKWMKAENTAKSIGEEQTYKIYGLTESLGETKGGKPKSIEEPCPDVFTVALSRKPKSGVIALAAPWNALPRKPRVADPTQKVYVDTVRDFLIARGVRDPKVRISKIIRADVEGDGEDEVLISATNYFAKDDEVLMHAPKAGSYSIVLLRRVVAGKVRTQLVAGEIYPKTDSSAAPNVYEVSAVLDLNGDGKLEVVVHSMYYEGGATTIYRCEVGKIIEVLSVACGV